MTVSSCLSPVSDLLRFIPGRVCLSVCPCADRCTCVKRLLNASFLSLLLIPRTRWEKVFFFLRENSKLHPHHPLVKNEPTSHCVHKSVLVRAYLHIWGELDVCIISAWVCCNYTVKVPMEWQPPRLAPRHIPSFYCVLCPTEKLLHVSICYGWWERWESRRCERTCVCKLRIKCVPLHA